nr:thermonuclease family protein [Staphylococcus aureus]
MNDKGAHSRDFSHELAFVGLEYDKGDKTDCYGRTLGYIFIDGTLLQKTLVSEGLARVAYVKEPSTKYLEELEKAQEQAKNQSIGIWSILGYVTQRGFSK